ncbi:MAG: ATP-dependent RNA helicase DeaD [Chlamydiia bacterium]|nr:ATP-dependent RNA helicase DeaD [Chlamydiia bacterium]MCH9618260.1 ATP-dependent RNA helicase DeaD [Chlamydiia bacterium]MCH9624655.1 ATP-dependent RNA helicase DeaD [Chlamydiia bacterium]
MGFSKFELDEKIIKAITDAGYTKPSKIQEQAIPVALEGKDVRASAQTGTGKTAAFLIPALQKIIDSPKQGGKGPKLLVLTPTRELAQQITVQAEKYSKHLRNIRSVCVVGGVPYHKQQAKLNRPYDILIATPGRLIDYMNRGKVNFSNLEMIVLDEADRMLDMGFSEPVEEIISATPQNRQTLLFSATLKGEVLKLSQRFMKDPVEIVIHSDHEKHENIDQKLLYVDNLGHKNDLLDHILNAEDLKSAIIFTATKRHCDELVDELEDKDFAAGALHGDMNQRQRSRTIKMLKEGRFNILVATDVAARGIDISDISHVINFDLPRDTEDYVHRIGRTGRAGKTGIAISFAGSKDIHMVPRIEKYTGQAINVIEIAGLEPRCKPKATGEKKSKSRKRGGGSRSGNRSGGGDRRSSGGRGGYGGGERRSAPRSDSRDRSDRGNSSGGERRSSPRGESRGGFGGERRSAPRSDSRDRSDRGNSYGGGERRSSPRSDSRDRSDRGNSFGGDRRSSAPRGGSERRSSGGYGGRSESFGGARKTTKSGNSKDRSEKRSFGEKSTFGNRSKSDSRKGGFSSEKRSSGGDRRSSGGRKPSSFKGGGGKSHRGAR